MSAEPGPLVVFGIGNVLLRDDGVGVHIVRELERRAARGDALLPQHTQLVDGGTLGLDLLSLIAGARGVLLLDAAFLGGAPGDVTVLRGDALGARPGGARAGGARPGGARPGGARAVLPAGIDDLLAAARVADLLPRAVSMVGVEPGEIAAGLDLTAEVEAALPAAAAAATDELWRLNGIAAAWQPRHSGLTPAATGCGA